MGKGSREKNIKSIINMEDRICQCNRCPSLTRCMRKPSLGKGDLEPDVLLVFECENEFNKNLDKVIALRDIIKKNFSTEQVYHSFMVRCQPKACPQRGSSSCYIEGKLLDKDHICLLTNRACEGIPIKPDNEMIMNCLPFLLEEIEILRPRFVILFGQQVSDYVLKSCGVFVPENDRNYYYEGMTFISTKEEKDFSASEMVEILELVNQNS